MPNYKALYFALFDATEQAIEALIQAQNEAEAMFCQPQNVQFTCLKNQEQVEKVPNSTKLPETRRMPSGLQAVELPEKK